MIKNSVRIARIIESTLGVLEILWKSTILKNFKSLKLKLIKKLSDIYRNTLNFTKTSLEIDRDLSRT